MCPRMWEHHTDDPLQLHWTSNAPSVGALGLTLQHLKIHIRTRAEKMDLWLKAGEGRRVQASRRGVG